MAARSIAGDTRVFAKIVGRHKQFPYGLIVRLVGNADDALDLVQKVFVAAHGALKRYDPDRPVRTWLARIAINNAATGSAGNACARCCAAFCLWGDVADAAAEQVSVEQAVSDRAELEAVRRRIAQMPAKLREILVLRTIEGLPQVEVAEMLGITEKAVETRLYRARRHLAE